MPSSEQPQNSKKNAKSFVRGLLAGTCLTAATMAQASTISEPPEFPQSLAAAVARPLPVGTNVVTGTAATDDDFVDFVGLLAGSPFSLRFVASGGFLDYSAFNSAGTQFGSTAVDVQSATISGTVPGNGQLVAQVNHDEGSAYTVTLTAALAPTSAVPEPASAALVGLGAVAAGVLGARRRKLAK